LPSLTLTPLSSIPLIRPGDNLAQITLAALHESRITLHDNDILVVTSKIVSKAEGRMVNLAAIEASKEAIELAMRSGKDARLVEILLRESREVLRVRPGTIIVEHRLGFVCANAGIDHSNVSPPSIPPPPSGEGPGVRAAPPPPSGEGPGVRAEDWVLLLPSNPDRSAAEIRARLESATGRRLGVMIIDSHGRAWRIGTVGMCIGLSGLPGVVDERGWRDLFGYNLQITIVGAADELAAAASLVMGQAAEGMPVVHVRGFPYPLREGSLGELLRPKEQDMFR
jgi:coenzyme F420-0:L-glutamate ligase/coenzyme F420-1:gamma-L-glutamate ligase